MFSISTLLVASIALCKGSKLLSETYYDQIHCNKTENGQYDCGFLNNLKEDKCYFKGVEYSVGEKITKEELGVDAKCIVSCNCNLDHPSETRADWTCVSIECPELFRRDPSATYKYTHDKCCAVSSSPASAEKEPKCTHKGKEYVVGEKFYPDEEPCLSCICGEGFTGELKEPFCRKIKCNVFLHYLRNVRNGCIPLFVSENSCCPIYEFRCPSEDDAVITPKNVEVNQTEKDQKCKFGNLDLAVGQSLSPKKLAGRCTECSCSLPPLVTCVMKECNDS